MRVGFLTASASREAGGLLFAMAPLARSLGDLGCHMEAFAGRDCFSEIDRPHWGQVPVHVLDKTGPAAFGYTPDLSVRLEGAALEVLHTHGLWMYPSVAAQDWGRHTERPWLVSPHGMLDPWAVQNGYWKKRLAGLLYEHRHLRGASCLHALCDAEARAIRAYGLINPIAIIPNGIDFPRPLPLPLLPDWEARLPINTRVLLFLGRLHPKKGLANLLWAWSLQRHEIAQPWTLVLAGWDQNGHRAELERIAESLGITGTIRFVGPQFGEQKALSLWRADAFILPSFSEGLPMTVLEAWSHRLPVLMTPACNLPEGFAAGAALETATDPDSIATALERLFAMPDEERGAMGKCGHHLVAERFTWPHVAEQMLAVYRWLLGDGPIPSCVVVD